MKSPTLQSLVKKGQLDPLISPGYESSTPEEKIIIIIRIIQKQQWSRSDMEELLRNGGRTVGVIGRMSGRKIPPRDIASAMYSALKALSILEEDDSDFNAQDWVTQLSMEELLKQN